MIYEIVFNGCYCGFCLSEDGVWYTREHGIECDEHLLKYDFPRHQPVLVDMVKELGSRRASGWCSILIIEKIKNPLYFIHNYDGLEMVLTPDIKWIDVRNID